MSEPTNINKINNDEFYSDDEDNANNNLNIVENKKKFDIYNVKDKKENFYKKKDIIPNVPFRCAIIGRSHVSGKGVVATNLICQDNFYFGDFDNIYIFSPSIGSCQKIQAIIDYCQIPEQNLFKNPTLEDIEVVYEFVKEQFETDLKNKKKVQHTLFYFDDLGSTNIFRKDYTIMSKLFQNSRHQCISIITCFQAYSSMMPSIRENVNFLILFNMSNRQLEMVENDHAFCSRKEFRNLFREATKEKHSFMTVNYDNPTYKLYQDKNFNYIKYNLKN